MNFNRRSVDYTAVPAPMQVTDACLALVREWVEPAWKAKLRSWLLPTVRLRSNAQEIGEGFQWGRGMSIEGNRIGRFVYVGPNTRIAGPVSIGDLCMLSSNIALVSNDHIHTVTHKPMRIAFNHQPRPPTVIESDCWIGYGAIILEGVTLARGTVVAAGAVVERDTEPYSIVGGVPARWIRQRFDRRESLIYDAGLYQENDR